MIGYAGMTHLGLNSAAAAAEKGFSILCFDPNPELISQLKNGQFSIVEPQLKELFEKNQNRIHFSSNPADLSRCEVVYISPDIPTNDQGQSDLTFIESLIRQVTPWLSREAILVILSQVPPGFTSKFRSAQTFYQVETLIFGQAIERALKPERFIIGASDPSKPLPEKWQTFLNAFDCPILTMRYESAELCKIAINLFLVSSVSTTNTIAELCEKIGADWFEIRPALELDKRIGKHAYLAPGLGIAGGNLERDLATFTHFANLHGTDSGIIQAWQKNAQHRRDWVLRKLHEVVRFDKKTRFALLGLSYKKDTSSLKNSVAIEILSHLQDCAVRTYDPVVKSLPDCYKNIEMAPSFAEAIRKADVILIMTPWDEFKKISSEEIVGKIVIDPFGILKNCDQPNYHKLGVS